ncbi:MAG: polysaccharide deacetylase family protein [Clostridia bacterium]|nr:polysaccharide deacetylase family protein [Clostridia bacterium]
MKKYTVFVHVVSNLVIIALLFGLYLACAPRSNAVSASAPIYKGNADEKRVALMINVYEGTEYVEGMMDVLDRFGETATFFVGGVWAEKNVELVKRIRLSFDIGNHGYLHKDHAALSYAQNKAEIELCDKLVYAATGKKMNLFAPPSGSMGEEMKKVCSDLGYKIIMWSKDTIDWRDKDEDKVYLRATTDVKSGDFILMHPTAHTLRALPEILRTLRQNGFVTATVSELVGVRLV